MGSLALIAGALGVGIGFGLQNIFNNLIFGIIILLERTLKVGDFVDLQSGMMGRVSEINMRYTRITTNDADDIIVPNSEFINGPVVNWTFGEKMRRMHIPFGVAYGTNKDIVREAAMKPLKISPILLKIKVISQMCGWLAWVIIVLNFELKVWVSLEGIRAPAMVHAKYLWEIETELHQVGIEIPFPQRDIHLKE